MKDLMDFGPVIEALKAVAIEADVNNGTFGQTYKCWLWDHETVLDKKRADLIKKKNRAVWKNDRETVAEVQKLISELPEPEKILIFKLMTPIPLLKGTKPVKAEGADGKIKTFKLRMQNVEYFYIHQNTIKAKVVKHDVTTEMMVDNSGNETPVVNIVLEKCMLDVREPKYYYQTMVRDKTAMVTEISYAAIQTITRIDRAVGDKLRGYEEE